MRIEVPEFKRCCCCIPLRYGILTWAYIRLVLNLVNLLVFLTIVIAYYVILPALALGIVIFGIVWILVDIGFSVTFIVGAHKKDYKLLRVFYYFLLTCIGLYNFIYIFIIGHEVYKLQHLNSLMTEDDDANSIIRSYRNKYLEHIIEFVANYCVTIVLTGYLILLIRSEILKLKRNCKFQFVNNAAENAQCRLSLETEVATEEIGQKT